MNVNKKDCLKKLVLPC